MLAVFNGKINALLLFYAAIFHAKSSAACTVNALRIISTLFDGTSSLDLFRGFSVEFL